MPSAERYIDFANDYAWTNKALKKKKKTMMMIAYQVVEDRLQHFENRTYLNYTKIAS